MKYSKFVFLSLTLLFFLQCRKDKPSYIFLITLDTTRADAIDHKPGNSSTPNLASLSSKGINFRNGYTNIPITLPSHASMFYSQYPHDLKIYNNGQTNNTKYPSLTQLLKSRGFSTGAVISLGVLKKDFGLDRGFDHYYENFSPGIWTKTAEEVNKDLFELINLMEGERSFIWAHYSDPHEPYFPPYFDGIFEIFSGEEKIFSTNNRIYPLVKKEVSLKPGINRIILRSTLPSQIIKDPLLQINGITYSDLEMLPSDPENTEINFPDNLSKKKNDKNDYFSADLQSEFIIKNKKRSDSSIKISFLYKLKESKESRRKLYFESIKYMDSQIGKLISFLKEKKILEKSVILIIGDHGEGLGEHWDHYGHIHFLNKVYTHVPFILYGKGMNRGKIRKDLVSNLDVATTILEIAGIKKPDFMQGAKLLSEEGKNKLILETFSPEAFFDAFSLIENNDQILFYPGRTKNRIEFSDLILDPLGTTRNKKDVPERVRSKLLKSILEISRTITATKGKVGKKKRIHEDILRSLGYL